MCAAQRQQTGMPIGTDSDAYTSSAGECSDSDGEEKICIKINSAGRKEAPVNSRVQHR